MQGRYDWTKVRQNALVGKFDDILYRLLRQQKEEWEKVKLGEVKDGEIYKTLTCMREMMEGMKEERLKLQVMLAKEKNSNRKGKESVVEESDSESEEEKEPPRKLTKAERKVLNQIQGGQGTSRKQGKNGGQNNQGGNGNVGTGLSGQSSQDQGQFQPQGGRGRGRGRGNGQRSLWAWQKEATCNYCAEKGHIMRFCQLLSKDEKEGIVFTTYIFDYQGNSIDPNIEGGMRKEVYRRMGRPLPATFRVASPEEAQLVEVEEVMASLHIYDSLVEPKGFREQVVERAQTITRRLARCRDSIIRLYVDMEEVWPGLPNVFLFGEWGDKREDASGQAGTSAPRETSQTGPMVSTMRPRPVLKRSAPTVAVQTRVRRRNEQLQNEKEYEKPLEEGPISISENEEDNLDEKLRAEEEERACHRALEREPEKGNAEVSEEEPRKKKNIDSIPVEQGVDIEQLVNKILESQRDLVTLKEILAVSPKIREEFKQQMTRKRVMTVKLGEIIPPEANWSPPGTKMDWPRSHNRADGLSRVEWDPQADQADESVPVDAFLKEQESRLSINTLAYMTYAATRHGKSICKAFSFHEVRPELVMEEPFIKEDPFGEQTAEEMMRLALTGDIDLMLDPLTIEQGHTRADDAFQIVGRMSYIMNLLVHEDRLRIMNAEEGGGEVKEAFKKKEYEGEYKKIGMWLNGELDESEVDPVVREKSKGFVVRDGHLFKKVADGVPKKVVCGISRQLDVIAALHDGVAGGHRSARVTLNKIQRLYFWEGMSKMVIDFCKSCFPCQQRSNIPYLEPLNPRYVAEPGAVVHLDLLVMPPGINGYRYIFDARDNLTGFIDGRAIRKRTGSVLAECIAVGTETPVRVSARVCQGR
ncbi:hypothetical protein CBR_g27948 [Chara braunii]|uniref:Integrase zinc-binding domain-containing protein n=1 Tax=Chara braunii TaxID=69332 RepID=A0A388L956_CHABU|nr:hypothetical protein CBR_g27948 [Chara braunii]|eukprot:GBG78723.1 hypothetical protein CBR_g27948 [Chara braunii]